MKAYRGIRGRASLKFNFGQWAKSRPGRFTPGKEARYPPTRDRVGLKPQADGLKKTFLAPHGIRTPNRQAQRTVTVTSVVRWLLKIVSRNSIW